VRKITALATAAGLLIALTACTTSAPSGACAPPATSDDASSLVTAPGAFGADPEATFPEPLVTKDLQLTQLSKGKGAVIYPGQYAFMQVSLYDAETGGSAGSSGYDESTPFIVRAGDAKSNFGVTVECQTVGSRVVTVLTGKDLIGFQGVTEDSIGDNADATFVAVIDIQGSVLGKAYGVPQVPQQGMPSVVTTPDGVPGLTIPGEDAPTTLKIAVLQQGDGEEVAEGDTIYLHYLRVDWDDHDSLKSTWGVLKSEDGLPQEVLVSAIDKTSGAGLTAGLLAAIKGQKVGSQILAVVPPAYGFPEGLEPTGVNPDGTLVYVLDILGIKSK
jgi:peptidylprolyl isomerase